MSASAEGERQDERWAEAVRVRLSDSGVPFAADLAAWEEIFAGRPEAAGPPVAWRPSPEAAAVSNPGRLAAELGLEGFSALHRWSCRERSGYWEAVIAALGVRFERRPVAILDGRDGPLRPRWLPGAEFNPIASCWGAPAERPALIEGRERDEEPTSVTYGELRRRVARLAGGLARLGVGAGDAVGFYLSSTPSAPPPIWRWWRSAPSQCRWPRTSRHPSWPGGWRSAASNSS